MDTFNRIIKTFAFVMAGITISTSLFITIFIPEQLFDITLIWEIIVMSAVCACGNFFYYCKQANSKKQMRIRIIGHYLYINAVVFGGAFLWEWLTPGLVSESLFMLLLVTVVYVIIMIAIFRQEVKMAESINMQLRRRYPAQEEDEDSL